MWYKRDNGKNKFVKFVPLNLSEMLLEIYLAYWKWMMVILIYMVELKYFFFALNLFIKEEMYNPLIITSKVKY